MESLIPVISKLQDVFAAVGSRENEVQLPQIVVVGSQSAGKSSVIEGIVGRDFLPRGTGIVTRRPLLIHLTHTPEDAHQRKKNDALSDTDWATFGHQPDKVYTDFEKVREEIQTETNRVTGTDRGISNEPIILKIFSENVVNLSLIDLPGITKVAVGEQPADIEEIVRKMILSYIENPQTIILAVTPANQDFANSEALKFAREVDPHGNRTLCVLTKLDLMDRGTDAMDVLRGEVIPVKLGIIGVVNRSQEDVKANKSIEDCLKDEISFLHKKYPTLASKNGTLFLAKMLNKLLIQHIRQSLPQLKHRIATMITDFQKLLNGMGESIVDHKKTFMQVLNHFSSAYIATLNGSSKNIGSSNVDVFGNSHGKATDGRLAPRGGHTEHSSTRGGRGGARVYSGKKAGSPNLAGGARIRDIFFNEFEKDISSIDSMGDLTVEGVLSAIQNGCGLQPPLFIPEKSFITLVTEQMKQFENPMNRCVELVHEELLRIIQHCGDDIQQEMQRFPLLYDRIRKVVTTILSTRIVKTNEFVKDLLDIELAFINTKHPEFTITEDLVKAFNEDSDIPDIPSKLLSSYKGRLNDNEKRDFCIIERLIDQYFIIVQKSIKDKVPKAIMNFTVNYVIAHLQSELITALYDQTNVDELLVENGNMTQRRKETAEMLKALNKANDVLSEIRDTEIW